MLPRSEKKAKMGVKSEEKIMRKRATNASYLPTLKKRQKFPGGETSTKELEELGTKQKYPRGNRTRNEPQNPPGATEEDRNPLS